MGEPHSLPLSILVPSAIAPEYNLEAPRELCLQQILRLILYPRLRSDHVLDRLDLPTRPAGVVAANVGAG
ncbi:hypothetical protein PG996_009382 [Apiospora saccharicola]|uniref:Uncharacterized protein n=1 Tax=Apiospora saccharicola TaxID=335842 RepID=A0ABR1UL68_9PEZI